MSASGGEADPADWTVLPASNHPPRKWAETFKRCVRHIVLLIRLRRRWAGLGRHLQAPRIQTLFEGLERRAGKLVRRKPAAQ
jgi:hypothetical protein